MRNAAIIEEKYKKFVLFRDFHAQESLISKNFISEIWSNRNNLLCSETYPGI